MSERRHVRMFRTRAALLGVLCPLGLAAWAPGAAAETIQIGNSLTAPTVLQANCNPCTIFQIAQGGTSAQSPVDGSISSWSFRTGAKEADYELQVLTPLDEQNKQFALRAQSPPVHVVNGDPEEVQTVKLAVALPIRAHDLIALHVGGGVEGAPTYSSGDVQDSMGEIYSEAFPATVNEYPCCEQLMLRATVAVGEGAPGGGGSSGGSGGSAPAPVASLTQTALGAKAGPGGLALSAAGSQIPAGQTPASYTFALGPGAAPVTCPGADPVLSTLVANGVSSTASVTVTTSAGTSATATAPISTSIAGIRRLAVKGTFSAPVGSARAATAARGPSARTAAGQTLPAVQAIAMQCLPASGPPSNPRSAQSVKGVKIGESATTLEALSTSGCADTVKVGIVEGVGCFVKADAEHPMPLAEEKILCTHYRLGCSLKEHLSEPASLVAIAHASAARAHASALSLEAPAIGFDTIYYSTQPVRVDGVEIDPVGGGAIVLARAGLVNSSFLAADSAYVISSDAVVKVAGIPVSLHVPEYAGTYKQAQGAAECGKKAAEGISEDHLAATNCLGSVKVPSLSQVEHLIPTVDGPIDLAVSPEDLGVELGEFTIPGGASPIPLIPELPLTGTIKVNLTGFDSASMAVHLELPGVLSDSAGHGLTGDTTLELNNRHGLQLNYLHVKVPSLAQLGLSRLKNLEFTYSRPTSLFEGKGTLDLNDLINGEVTLGMAFEHGSFKHAHVDYTAPTGGGYPLFGPVFLTYVGADVGVNPTTFRGQANLGIGPAVIAKCGALGVEGTMTLVFGNPFTIDSTGNVQVLCANFGYSSRFHADSDGHVGFGLGVGYPIPGLGSISGELYGQAYADPNANLYEAQVDGQAKAEFAVKKCESIGPVEECTPTIDFTQSANATISIGERGGRAVGGAGVCTHLSFPVLGGFDVGAGTADLPGAILGASTYNLAAVASRFQILLSNCSLTPFRLLPPPAGISRAHGRAAAGTGGYTIAVDPHTGTEVVGLQGSGGAPAVTLTGPGGQQVHAIADGISVGRYGLSVRQPSTGQTLIEIPHATAGAWTLQVAPGSPPVASVQVARKLPEPRIRAQVGGHRARRTLTYRLTPQPGMSVRFVEAVDGGASPIGAARGAHGRIAFTPSPGSPRPRTILAQIFRNGQLAATQKVARFSPGSMRVGRPSHLRVRRTGGGWTISFVAAANADEHLLTVHFADGAQVLFALAKGRHVLRIGAAVDHSRPTAVQVVGLRDGARGRPAILVSRLMRAKRRR